MTRTEKVSLLMTFHTLVAPIDEQELMNKISYIVNGVDDTRIDWEPYVVFANTMIETHGALDEVEDEEEDFTDGRQD